MPSFWTYNHNIHTPATHIPYIEGDKSERTQEVTVVWARYKERDARLGAGLESSFSSFGETSLVVLTHRWRGGCRGSLSCRGSLTCRVSLWEHDSRNTRIPYSWNVPLTTRIFYREFQ